MLSAIPAELLSDRANAHFRELERKFGEPEGDPVGITGGFVESPIKKDAADKMTDDQWLHAIAKYHSMDWHRSDDELQGGALELARVLEQRVKEEPRRFSLLSLRFPVDANPLYLDRTLAGLKDAAVSIDVKLQVCRKAFADSPQECGKSIADVLGAIKDPLPSDSIEMLHWLATEHEDPATEGWQEDAIRYLIITDSDYIERFRTTLELMVKDSSVSVLSCEDRLFATCHVRRFIRDNLNDCFADLRPIIERMLRSSVPEVCEIGAELACIAALIHEEGAFDLADDATQGNARSRLGVAQVASTNIAAPEYRDWCEARLVDLFNDQDEDVRRKAASCFLQLRGKPLDRYENLIVAFYDSKAYQEDSSSILSTLEESLRPLPGATCMICEKFFDRFSDEAKDIRTGRSADTYTIPKLIFRMYQQHQNDDTWASRSLDLIDRLCPEEVHAAEREFEQFER